MTADRPARAQPMEPPYLLSAVISRRGVGVAVTGDAGNTMVEIAAHGRWSPLLCQHLTATLRLCLAGPSAAIIVDLHDLGDPYGASLPFWVASAQQARSGSAPVHLAFCLPGAAALSRRLRGVQGSQPSVFTMVPEARRAIAARISRADRIQARLEPRPASVKAARDLVTEACRAWHLPELRHDTWLVVSELAANAVQHARTDFIITLSRSGTRLHVAVHDCVSRFPRPGEPSPTSPQASLDERGRGLRLVHTIASAWGAIPTRDGKVVWATVT
ncbi:ATP-binding protein [Actinoplanes sp. NPDC051470]|uniref:ATP-binding protein n=1 Tax=Actinoplanes sp. NPDC051470 TaxID=3157224 RepID=UPI0034468316